MEEKFLDIKEIDIRNKKKYIGFKMALRAVKEGNAGLVYMAGDINDKMKEQILSECHNYSVEVCHIETMKQLGKAALIEVGAAVVAIDKSYL